MFSLQCPSQFTRGPALETDTEEKHDGEAEQVVVIDGVKVLEVEVFDPFAHVQHVSCGRQTVERHPHISWVELDEVRGVLRHECSNV